LLENADETWLLPLLKTECFFFPLSGNEKAGSFAHSFRSFPKRHYKSARSNKFRNWTACFPSFLLFLKFISPFHICFTAQKSLTRNANKFSHPCGKQTE